MEIYLIRHTASDIESGICYGQADLDIAESFTEEAAVIAKYFPGDTRRVISSPLQRCKKLANFLFPGFLIELNDDLKEIHCGDWELKKWDEIPRNTLDNWMKDFVSSPFPNGESYEQFYERIVRQFEKIVSTGAGPIAIVSHGGVMRSVLSHVTKTPLKDSFDRFKIPYGHVIKLIKQESNWRLEVLI